jgi:hypothetical protein
MTAAKLFWYGYLLTVVLALTKVVFFGILNSESVWLAVVLYAFAILFTIACVRRLGILNYLESFIVITFWFLFAIAHDLLFVGLSVGLKPYKTWTFWLIYPMMLFTIFFFHKKRHVDIRKGGAGK